MKTKAIALYEKRGRATKYRKRNPVSAHTPVTIPAGILAVAAATPFVATLLGIMVTKKGEQDSMEAAAKNMALFNGIAAVGGGITAAKASDPTARAYGKAVAVGGGFGLLWSLIGLITR